MHTPPHVLLLEDDPAIARTVCYALERDGIRCTHSLLIVDPEAVPREGDVALRFDSSGLALVRVTGPDGLCAPIEAQAQDHPEPFDGVVLLRLHRVAWASQ